MNNNKDNQSEISSRQPHPGQTRKKSVAHPRYNLQQAEKLAKAAFDIGPRHCDQDKVAQAVGYKNAQNGAFIALRATASQFGLIDYKGGYLSVSEPWIEVFNSEDPELLKHARQNAMHQPDLYKQLLADYANRQLPSLEKLTRELYLHQKYRILKDAANGAAQTFIESANYAILLDAKGYLQFSEDSENEPEDLVDDVQRDVKLDKSSPRLSTYNVNSKPHTAITAESGTGLVTIPDGLDRIEVKLLNGQKAYLFVPVPLPFGEKERLKRYIDLILEDAPTSTHSLPTDKVNNISITDEGQSGMDV